MKAVKAAAVTILFLLIPHQAPLAGPADAAGQAAAAEQVAPSPSSQADDRRAERFESDGFVWSAPASTSHGVWSSSAGHFETDGYSWSVRSAGSNPDLDPAL